MSLDEKISSFVALTRATSPRTLIHQLLNGYGLLREGELSGPWLVAALGELGHRPAAVRQMLRRMLRTGELTGRRQGRVNWFRPSDFSRAAAEAAGRKLFGPEPSGWDQRWTLALYQFRVGERGVREHVRVVLSLQGFGSLSRGVFLHPRDRVKPVSTALAAVGLADRVRLFRAERSAGPSDPETAAAAWDLHALAEGYRGFQRRFGDLPTRDLPPRECFVVSAAAVAAYLEVCLRDPELPEVLLPADWPGRAAAAQVRQLLGALEARMLRHGDALSRPGSTPG